MNKLLLFAIVISAASIIIGSTTYLKRPEVAGASTENDLQISGLVLPHHDLANGMIITAVKRCAQIRPDIKYIVILSPNHYRPQSETFTSTTKLKDFSIATEQIGKIEAAYPKLVLDKDLLNGEHGLYIPMKYLAFFYPGARFIPIAVAPYYTTEQLKQMARILINILPPQTLYVASTDFSHNHMQTEASLYDAMTIDTIKNFNYQKLFSFGNDNLDSPAAMGVVMYAMQHLGSANWNTWQESHGAMLTGDPQLSGTSYVTGVFEIQKAGWQ